MNKFIDELTGEQLYVATDLDGGDLLGAVWAKSESDAYDYFNNDASMIADQADRLYVELAEKSGYSIEEILDEFPDIVEESACYTKKDTIKLAENIEPDLYEVAAARAMHFMHINCNMEYQEIADELGIDVQVVSDLIGIDSYDDRDIMLEAEKSEEEPVQEQMPVVELSEGTDLKESYRRTVSRGAILVENELFVDFN